MKITENSIWYIDDISSNLHILTKFDTKVSMRYTYKPLISNDLNIDNQYDKYQTSQPTVILLYN